jgi:phosphatidylglycerophosphate synthase
MWVLILRGSFSLLMIRCTGLTEWIDGWMAKGWKTSEGGAVLNAGLIKLIHFMISKREGPVQVRFH